MFAGKAGVYPNESPFRCYTLLDPGQIFGNKGETGAILSVA
jgi:hypothetical protein